MNIHGYCTRCRKIKRIPATPTSLAGGTPTGVCSDCTQKERETRAAVGELTIYVPIGDMHRIDPGSAVVGRPGEGSRITVYYEGDRFGSMGGNYDTMLLHAADRLVARYPTVACASLWWDTLQPVGTYDYATHTADITDPDTLNDWRAHARH